MSQLKDPQTTPYEPPYDGDDMVSHIMERDFKLHLEVGESIQSMTNVKDTAIIVTNYFIWRAKPMYQISFCLERLCAL